MTRRRVGAAGAMFAVLAASGCGMLGGGGEADSLQSMLENVPGSADSRAYVLYGNLARLRGDAEPSSDVRTERKTLFDASTGRYVVAEPAGRSLLRKEFAQESGFELKDIDASVEVGEPPNQLSLYVGRFDTAKVGAALTKSAPFAEETETGERAGVTTYSVGEDGKQNLRSTSLLRPVGRSLRVGVTGERIWLTSPDRVLNEALDAAAGDGTSLADDDRYVTVAKAVDDSNAFNAFLLGDPSAYTADAADMVGRAATPDQVERFQELIDQGKLGLEPWEVAAVADAPGELVVVLLHADGELAQQNSDRLRTVVQQGMSSRTGQPWSKLLTMSAIDVKDNLLVVRMKAKYPIAIDIIRSKDNFILIAKK